MDMLLNPKTHSMLYRYTVFSPPGGERLKRTRRADAVFENAIGKIQTRSVYFHAVPQVFAVEPGWCDFSGNREVVLVGRGFRSSELLQVQVDDGPMLDARFVSEREVR